MTNISNQLLKGMIKLDSCNARNTNCMVYFDKYHKDLELER